MATIAHSIRPLLRLRAIPSCVPRRCASSASTAAKTSPAHPRPKGQPIQSPIPKSNRPARSRPPPSIITQDSAVPTRNATALGLSELPPELARKQWYAQKLYESGRTMIYRPPSHFGIYTASWLMGGSALITASALAYTNLWAFGVESDHPTIVAVAYRVAIVVFSALGWFMIMRSWRIIKSIDLVSVDGLVKMAVQVRRPLPFLKPKVYLVAPHQFQFERKFVQQMEYPDFMLDEEVAGTEGRPPSSLSSSIGRAISRGMFYIFASTKRIMTLEGFMWVSLEGTGGQIKLDTQGVFSNGDKVLLEMCTIKT
ncbi:hypothetical protein H2200_003607 [Cladophialophora chaetospira]|uniref:Uncharacterized protein n=1 Tax=Cladophialophora chaetospira TaxID=386627 RepID=A0AA38XER3_9EURO|nr:hypothetical protein H2200_003607 [Cladophialophora chaetospira]